MRMSLYNSLQGHQQVLTELYSTHIEAVVLLQKTFLEQVLPDLILDLGLTTEEEELAAEWINDTPSLFRVFKRNQFIPSFTLKSLRSILTWRLTLPPRVHPDPPPSFFKCLPDTCHDPFGRPVIYIELSHILEEFQSIRHVLTYYMELLRLHLLGVNARKCREGQVILQYIILVNVEGASLKSMHCLELMRSYINEVVPRFPGMIAAVFFLNFSWAHFGLWSVIKHALPSSSLSQVFFPTSRELTEFFEYRLPHDIGGHLPLLALLDDPLHSLVQPGPQLLRISEHSPPSAASVSPQTSKAGANSSMRLHIPRAALSATSLLNPFFGYPVLFVGSSVAPEHGRRRKRDLISTLTRLLWARWKSHVQILLMVLFVVSSMSSRTWLDQWLRKTTQRRVSYRPLH